MGIRILVFLMTIALSPLAQAAGLEKGIVVSNAWVQAMPPSQNNTAAYMLIINSSAEPLVLVSATTDAAQAVEIHQMSDMNGMMHMAMKPEVVIPAQGQLVLKPGGFHIMLIGLKKSLNIGGIIPIVLHFQDGGVVPVEATVHAQ